jgi:hypothetical protein
MHPVLALPLSHKIRTWFSATVACRHPGYEVSTNANHFRYIAPILFPLLDSFPASIFDVGSGQASKLAVHTGLTTSTAVADQVRAMEQIVKRLVRIEEREALCNGLQVIAEEYDEGWDSGTDSDDDA